MKGKEREGSLGPHCSWQIDASDCRYLILTISCSNSNWRSSHRHRLRLCSNAIDSTQSHFCLCVADIHRQTFCCHAACQYRETQLNRYNNNCVLRRVSGWKKRVYREFIDTDVWAMWTDHELIITHHADSSRVSIAIIRVCDFVLLSVRSVV